MNTCIVALGDIVGNDALAETEVADIDFDFVRSSELEDVWVKIDVFVLVRSLIDRVDVRVVLWDWDAVSGRLEVAVALCVGVSVLDNNATREAIIGIVMVHGFSGTSSPLRETRVVLSKQLKF